MVRQLTPFRDQCIDVLHVSIAVSPCQNDHADKLHGVERKPSIGDSVNLVIQFQTRGRLHVCRVAA